MKAFNIRSCALLLVVGAVGCINVGHDEETGCFVDPTEPGCKATGSGGSTGGSATSGAGASGTASPPGAAGAAGEGGSPG